MKRSFPIGRHILLAAVNTPGVVRFLSQAVQLADGARQSWVTLTRIGNFTDPRYGEFSITLDMLGQMVANFDKRVLGQDVFIDVSHKPSDGAAGKVMKLSVEGGKLRALVEWTPFGLDAIKQRGFSYLSAEYHEAWADNERQQTHGCVLLGAGLTVRPVIKHLDPVQLSQDNDHDHAVRVAISPSLLKELTEHSMNKFLKALLAQLIVLGYTETSGKPFLDLLSKQLEALGDDEQKCLAAQTAVEQTAEATMKQIRHAGGDGRTVQITLAAPAVDVQAAVTRALADRDANDLANRTALTAKLKLLSDTIAEGDKTLTPEGVKKFADDYAPLVTAQSTDDQVRHLAGLAVKQSQALTAAQKLVTLGYNPVNGSVHITQDTSNGIKALQETVDRRLGYIADRKYDMKRFERTNGELLLANKEFAEKALAEFDQANAAQLAQEHKVLAGGVGSVSDVAVPKIAERTVLRETLYGLMSLNLVNVGTAPFASEITIPYSYRDTSAAGVSGLRRYELQSIRKAGVIQTDESTRPIPQKLSFQVSSELRNLMSASVIDFEPIAENVRNIVRIVGEDTELINLNEIALAADEFGAFSVSTETKTGSVNGTNRIFPLVNFPVCKPRAIYNLKGELQGSVLRPIVVNLGGSPKTEYVLPADGSALPAGQYWVMDYNLGEIQFVTETGAAYTPPNATALTVAYWATTNVNKFNTDLGSTAVDVFYDTLLYTIGLRKSLIEDQRFYNPDMILMSGTVNTALSQAKTFQANSARVATGLAPDGSVGRVKDMPDFRPRAPGSLFGDTRILVGERGNTRFRMVKPWTMVPLEQARNAAGAFIDAQEAFGTQWVGSHTPTQLKGASSSIILYSSTGRVARA